MFEKEKFKNPIGTKIEGRLFAEYSEEDQKVLKECIHNSLKFVHQNMCKDKVSQAKGSMGILFLLQSLYKKAADESGDDATLNKRMTQVALALYVGVGFYLKEHLGFKFEEIKYDDLDETIKNQRN